MTTPTENQAVEQVRNRLDLFKHVCDAVQHAHQKGVIHRDPRVEDALHATRAAVEEGILPG